LDVDRLIPGVGDTYEEISETASNVSSGTTTTIEAKLESKTRHLPQLVATCGFFIH